MIKILITGGAGYIGSILTPLLLEEGFNVTVYDALLYGGSSLLPFVSNKNFSFIKGDIRNKESLDQAIKKNDVIIHLAAIVGLPACNKDKRLAHSTNVQGTKNVVDNLSPNQQLIHASTVSNYGASPGNTCNEKSPLNPISYYGKTKTEAEKMEYSLFNVGDNSNNYSKEEIAMKIKERIDYYLHFADIGEDEDKRNYSVSYEKINSLGFKTKKTVDEGIDELIKACQIFEFKHPYKNI